MFLSIFDFLVVVLLGWFLDRFLIDFGWILGSKIDQKSIKNLSKRWSKTRCKLGWILVGSWSDFGWIWAPSWGASWGQVGTKIWKVEVPRRFKKKRSKTRARVSAGSASSASNGRVDPYKYISPPHQDQPVGHWTLSRGPWGPCGGSVYIYIIHICIHVHMCMC